MQQVRKWYFHTVAVNNQCWFDWMQHFWALREIRTQKFWKRRPVCICAPCPNCLFSPTEGLHCYPAAEKACKSKNIEGHHSTGQKLSSLSDCLTHLTQSVKKWGLSACTMITSKKSLQFFPTIWVIPLSLWTGKSKYSLQFKFGQSWLVEMCLLTRSQKDC